MSSRLYLLKSFELNVYCNRPNIATKLYFLPCMSLYYSVFKALRPVLSMPTITVADVLFYLSLSRFAANKHNLFVEVLFRLRILTLA